MKECPHCHASIEESARFCLYCMTSLEEKQTVGRPKSRYGGWIVAAIAVVVLLLVGGLWLWMVLSADGEPTKDTVNTPATTTAATASTTAPAVATDAVDRTTGATSTTSTTSTVMTEATTTAVTEATTTTTAATEATTTTTAPTEQTTTTTAPTAAGTDTYLYRLATRDDVYLALTIAMPDDVLIITGIATPSADGIYRVPNTIDGKRVVAIADGAFAGEDVRVVVLPDNVSTVNSGAFAACPNLTDIYFVDSVFTYFEAFSPSDKRTGTLTIHCPQDCDNRNFRYYRNIASEWFGAEYQEWNGGELT